MLILASIPHRQLPLLENMVKIAVIKPKKQICNRKLTVDQGGQKNRNGKMTAVPFYHAFY